MSVNFTEKEFIVPLSHQRYKSPTILFSLITVLYVAILLLAGGTLFYAFYYSYDQFCQTIFDLNVLFKREYGYPYTLKEIQKLFSPQDLWWLRLYTSGVLGLCTTVYLCFLNRRNEFLARLQGQARQVVTFFNHRLNLFSARERLFLKIFFLLKIATLIYFSFYTPVTYDEAATYNLFVSKGPIATLFNYCFPNNHIFHSLLAVATTQIPIFQEFALRLPAILASLLALLLFVLFFRSYASSREALIGLLIFSSLNLFLQYQFQARGYSLLILFYLIGFFSTLKLVESNFFRAKYWIPLVLSSILGAYTVPTYLYCFVSLYGYLLIILLMRWQSLGMQGLRKFFYSGVITGFVILFLYCPVFIFSGPKALFANSFVESQTFSEILAGWFSHYKKVFNKAFGVSDYYWENIRSYAGITIMLGMTFLCVIRMLKSKSHILHLSLFGISISALTPFVHLVFPPARTFSYIVVPLAIMLTLLLVRMLLSRYIHINIVLFFTVLYMVTHLYPKTIDRRGFYYEDTYEFLHANSLWNVKLINPKESRLNDIRCYFYYYAQTLYIQDHFPLRQPLGTIYCPDHAKWCRNRQPIQVVKKGSENVDSSHTCWIYQIEYSERDDTLMSQHTDKQMVYHNPLLKIMTLR